MSISLSAEDRNLRLFAPMPEQIRTIKMHFGKVMGLLTREALFLICCDGGHFDGGFFVSMKELPTEIHCMCLKTSFARKTKTFGNHPK